jgi:hypothetical protein
MIILHAGRIGKQFFLWGESPAEKEIQGSRRGLKPKNPTAKPYPYDLGVAKLFSSLERLIGILGRNETRKLTKRDAQKKIL